MDEPTKEQLRAARAFSAMPYGAGIYPRFDRLTGITLDTASQFMEDLAERLREHAESCNKDRAEFQQLRQDLAAFRRIVKGE
ncbi:MAG: hypothetical protein AB7V39_00615 [Nitrospiraceae bacterium]